MAGLRITQLHPASATGRRYGSFAGKAAASAGHPVGKLTQLRPQRATGRRYGSFAGKPAASAGTHPVSRITQLHPQMATGRRYGSFTGKPASGLPSTILYQRTIRGLDATGYDDWTISYQA